MVIKDFMDELRNTIMTIKKSKCSGNADNDEIDFQRRKLAALKEIRQYIKYGDWTRTASREKFMELVQSDFDYKLIEKRYKTSQACLDVFVYRQNDRLKRIIGGALTLISLNRIDEGMTLFYANAGIISARDFGYKVEDLLPVGVNSDSFLVSDCDAEVGLLRSLMRSNVQKLLDSADKDKLAYLVFLLNTKDKAYSQQKAELIGKLRQNL